MVRTARGEVVPKPVRLTPAAKMARESVVEVENLLGATELLLTSAAQMTLPLASVVSLPPLACPEQSDAPRVPMESPPPVIERPPARVEVAVEVLVIDPVVSLPIEEDARKESTKRPRVEKSEVVVAFVMVARTKVESTAVEVAVMIPAVKFPTEVLER